MHAPIPRSISPLRRRSIPKAVRAASALLALAGLAPSAGAQSPLPSPSIDLYTGTAPTYAVSPALAQDIDADNDPPGPRYQVLLGLGGGDLIGLGGGDTDVEVGGASFAEDAGILQLLFEAHSREGIGGGVRFGGTSTDDIDGLGTDVTSASLFIFFSYAVEEARWRMPIRAGVDLHSLAFEDDAGSEVTFDTPVLTVEIEPEVLLTWEDDFHCSAYATLGLGFGEADVEVDFPGLGVGDVGDDDATFLRYGLGIRFVFDRFLLGLGYFDQFVEYEDSDLEVETTGVQLELGVRW